MSRRVILVVALALAAVVLLAACEKSAVPAQSTLVSPTSGPQSTLSSVDAIKTQTAVGTATALYLTMQPGASLVTGTAPTVTTIGGSTVAPVTTPIPTVVTPSAPTPTPGKPATYKLQEGEFLYCLARRFDVNPTDLLQLNGLSDTQVLQPGMELKIPQTGSFPGERALIPHPTTYTVKLGETIYKVACAFGDVDPIYLAAYNGLLAPYTLEVGKVLNIP